jgi:hypothetical protein
MRILIIAACLAAALPVQAGPAGKLANKLGISKAQARQILAQPRPIGGAAPAGQGPSVTQGIPMGPGVGAGQ